MTNSYCIAVSKMDSDNPNVHYHDHEYGFPINSDDKLFGRLLLEINQAGLSWLLILKKKENIRKAYADFSIEEVASFTESDRTRLLNDEGIVRNKLKVNAAIYNAQTILKLQNGFGSFKAWLDHNHPNTKEEWVKLFKKTFKFTGGEITNEFLMSCGYLKGAHDTLCPVYKRILDAKPAWI